MMPRAKTKWRQQKRREIEEEIKAANHYRAIIRKLTGEYSRYAEMEDCKRGRLL